MRRREGTEDEWLFVDGPIQDLTLETDAELSCVEIDEATFEEILPAGFSERGLRSTIDCQTIESCIEWADRLSGSRDNYTALDIIRYYIRFDAYPETLNAADPPPMEEVRRQLDRDFCNKLGPEDTSKPCRRDVCGRGAVKLSLFCRRHHFENIRKRPYPFDD